MHWLNLAVAALVLTALALVAAGLAASGHEGPAWAFAGLALATPALYGAVLYRRTAFAFERPELAARAGGIYFLVLLTGIVYLYLTHLLSAFSSFVIVAIASFVVIFLIRAAKLGPASVSNAAARGWREYLCAHLGYGKWALPGGLCAWVPVNLVLIYLAGSKGLDAAGGYRALFNLIQPAVQFNAALGLVTIPILVKAISGGRTGKPLLRIAAGPVALSAAYGLVLLFLGRPLMHLLYGGEYRELATYLWLVAIFPVVTAIGSMLGTALRALERPMYIFFARATGAILVAASWPLMPSRGLLFALLLTLSGLTLITICQAVLIFPARVARAAT